MTTTNGDPAVVEPAPAEPQPAGSDPTAYTPPAGKKPAEIVVEATPDEDVKSGDSLRKRATEATAAAAATWLGFYRQPPSIAEAWHLSSKMDRKRVPAESGLLGYAWYWANRSERILTFALIFILLAVTATLLWCSARPSRRIGLYLITLVVFVLVPWMTWS
jgi:hypothetical protein